MALASMARRALPVHLGVFALCLGAPGYSKNIELPISVNGEQIGEVDVYTAFMDFPNFPNQEGVRGAFGVLKEDADGNPLTLAELEQYLGQDHLNWFQKILDIKPPLPGVPTPSIDPPKGGMPGVWADARPWYLDETPAPQNVRYNANRQLTKQGDPAGSTLNFFDTPHGQPPGTTIKFATYLVSDYGDKTYRVLGGFAWSTQIDAAGNASIASLEPAGPFQQEYRDEISTDFRYEDVATLIARGDTPEPASAGLVFSALVAFGSIAVLKRRQARARRRR